MYIEFIIILLFLNCCKLTGLFGGKAGLVRKLEEKGFLVVDHGDLRQGPADGE